MEIGRVVTAMVTPFGSDTSLDLGAARRLARHLVAGGSDSIVVFGTTGESPALTEEEKIALLEAVVDEVGSERVVAGTGSNSTQGSIRFTKRAVSSGAGAVLLVCPYYNKPGQEGMYRHFASVAEAAGVPAILYNIPGRTGVNLMPDTVARLARTANIVAIKEASGSLDQVSAIRAVTPPDFRIYSGDDSLTLPILAVGGHGVVSVASHVAGPRIARMIEAFFSGGVKSALDIHLSLLPLFKALFVATNPIPVKKALDLLGLPCGSCRLPLEGLTAEQERTLLVALEKTGVERFQ